MSRPSFAMPLQYSKVCDLAGDTVTLLPFLTHVSQYPEALAGQHSIRLWEYAMALYAIEGWQGVRAFQAGYENAAPPPLDPLQICDVGGAGSNFWQVLGTLTSDPILIIDPSLPATEGGGWSTESKMPFAVHYVGGSVEAFAAHAPHDRFDIITCVSVVEHVEKIRPFFRAIQMLLKPNGLLFLTTDYWDSDGDDTAHFHWMRTRIYNAERIRRLQQDLRELGFKSFGTANWEYHGPQLYDYAVASLAVTKTTLSKEQQ